MRLSEGLAGLVAERLRPQFVADAPTHPRFKYFRGGRRPLPLLPRRSDRRARPAPGCPCRPDNRRPDVWRRRHASADDGRRAAGADGDGRRSGSSSPRRISGWALRRISGGAGIDTTSLFRGSIQSSGAPPRQQSRGPAAAIPIDKLEERASQLALHSRINYLSPPSGVSALDPHLGRPARGGPLGATGRATLRGVRHPRIAADLFGRPSASWPAITSRAPRTSAFRSSASASTTQGYFRQRLDRDGWQHEDYIDVDHRSLPMRPALSQGVPVTVSSRHALERLPRALGSRSCNTLLLLDSNVEGNQPEDRELTARLCGGDDRIRIRQELLLGVGGVRALALGIARASSTSTRASAFAPLGSSVKHGRRGRRCLGSVAARRSASRLHHARRCRLATTASRRRSSKSTSARCGITRRRSRPVSWPRTREPVGRQRNFLHDGPCAQVVPPRQRRLVAARPGLARDVEPSPDRSEDRADWPHHQRRPRADMAGAADAPGLRPPPRSQLGRARAMPRSGSASTRSTTARLGRRTQTLKVQLIETVRRRTSQRASGRACQLVAPLRRALVSTR